MFGLDGRIDWTELDRSFADVEQRAKRMAPLFRELRKPLRQDQRDHEKARSGPDGPWRPRARSTELRNKQRPTRKTKAMKMIAIGKFKRRSRPKNILGKIPRALLVTSGELFVRIASRSKAGPAHQRGLRVGNRARLPVRMFIYLGRRIVDVAAEKIADYVLRGWKR